MITFAKLRIGTDFGSRAPKTFFTDKGKEYLKNRLGNRVENDIHGLMVYNSNPPPLFATQKFSMGLSYKEEDFEKNLKEIFTKSFEITKIDRLAFDFFNMSFFQSNAETRFMALMIAIEILIERKERDKSVVEFIEQILKLARGESMLGEEKERIISGLNELKNESISQAGQRLADELLPENEYQKLSASQFFKHCYNIRSSLVHGSKSFPSRDEISQTAGSLEVFVSDLLVKSVIK
jgi:hypothetical protein